MTTKKKDTTRPSRKGTQGRKLSPTNAAAQLQQQMESDKLTGDQRGALLDALYPLFGEIDINPFSSPEVAAATLKVAVRDCADDDYTKKLLEVMQKIEQGHKFKGYQSRQRAKGKRGEAANREAHRIEGVRASRSQFFIRILQSSKRGALAAFGIPETSVGIFERYPVEPFAADDIVLVSMSGNTWDACHIFTYSTVPAEKWIIGRLISLARLTPRWKLNGDGASEFMEIDTLRIQQAKF